MSTIDSIEYFLLSFNILILSLSFLFSVLGFYFVRNTPLTMYFFGSLLRMGDLISATKSHQAALSALLAEFAGWKGLRVKVWHKGGDTLFPGGFEYHQSKDYMRKMIADEIQPYIFHMSW